MSDISPGPGQRTEMTAIMIPPNLCVKKRREECAASREGGEPLCGKTAN